LRAQLVQEDLQHLISENTISSITKYLLIKYQDIISDSNNITLNIADIVEQIVHYYESIIFCMPCNVYWLNNKCVTIGCNKNVLDMFGFSKISEFRGLSFEEMGALGDWSPEATESFKRDTMEVINYGQAKLNIEEPVIPHKNGNLIYFLSSRVPLLDITGKVIAVVGISVDISARKQMEQRLIEAKQIAEVANKAKTEFIRNARHDIRTPLVGIVGFIELLQNETNISNIHKYTRYLLSSSKQLLSFLNAVLGSVDSSSGVMPILQEKFNLRKRIYEVINIYRVKALEKGIALYAILDPLIPSHVIGDPIRVFRIIMELTGNALKYTKQGYVKVSVKLDKIDEFKVFIKIEIEDSGIGISPEKQLILFERFTKYQVTYNNSNKGSGLGLFITRQFIQDLGGNISINSSTLNGTKFTCIVPMQGVLKESNVKDHATMMDRIIFDESSINFFPTKPIAHDQPVKVLVVEDQLHASLVVKEILGIFGCVVDVANDGYKAINLFEKNFYDLVLMDIGLPYMDGYEVTKKLRLYEQRFKYRVPIVALTAHFCLEEQRKCLQAEINAIFTKPLFKNTMLYILQFFVSRFKVKEEFLEHSQELEYED